MSSPDEIAAAFERVDSFLMAAGEVATSVELLLERAQQQGVSETRITNHLGLNATVVRWLLKLAPDATTDRSIDLDEADVGGGAVALGASWLKDLHHCLHSNDSASDTKGFRLSKTEHWTKRHRIGVLCITLNLFSGF